MCILELQNVEKIYGEKENQVKALRGINLQVEEGEFVAIVGTSGSGKSTILNLIGGLDYPTRGKIFIKNTEKQLPFPYSETTVIYPFSFSKIRLERYKPIPEPSIFSTSGLL